MRGQFPILTALQARLVPVAAHGVEAGGVEVRGQPRVGAHPAAEAQAVRGGHCRHRRAVQPKLHVRAALGLKLLRRYRHLRQQTAA